MIIGPWASIRGSSIIVERAKDGMNSVSQFFDFRLVPTCLSFVRFLSGWYEWCIRTSEIAARSIGRCSEFAFIREEILHQDPVLCSGK